MDTEKKLSMMEALRKVTTEISDWTNDKLSTKVNKVSGKSLSTNDYTTVDKNKVANMPNDLIILNGKLFLAQDGTPLPDSAVTLPEGGGGGTGPSASITLINLLDSNILTVASGQKANLKFSFTSSETDANGTAYIYVNDVLKMSTSIISGDNSIDISSCLTDGINSVRLTCMDIYSNSKSLSYSVEMVSLKLSSQFDATIPYEGDISYTYTPVINANKIMHYILDGVELDTEEITTSGRQQTYVIPNQPHGSHTFEVYFTAEINGETVESNHLYYDLMFITSGVTTPIISCVYSNNEIEQFETITIPYIVYSPTSLTSNIILSADQQVVNELVVDRTQQKWSFRADEYGEVTLTIACGEVIKTINLTVAKSQIDISATTDNLELFLSSYGRNNNEADPANWSYNDITCAFENYNWVSDGWLVDDNGSTVHRVTGDARLRIPLQIFASDFRTTGKTLEFEMSTKEVLNYDTTVLSCYNEGRGFIVTAQQLKMASEQSSLSTRYKENEHIRVSIVVEKKSENRLLLCYINGIMSGATQYPADDDFSQASPVDITIGSNECTIDLYNIRVYDNSLTRHQIIDNWIADTQDVADRANRYKRNDIYDAYGRVVMSQLPSDLPYMVLQAASLPQYKGDKKSCSGYFVDPLNPERNFSFVNAQNDVQGTSSQYYYVKNFKIKFKNGFVLADGSESDTYAINNNAVPVDTFTMKADVASSEGAFNVVLAMLYDDLCPFKTPAQEADERIRQTIEGFPMAMFWDNGTEIKFIGKYNFNNDKGTEEVFGFQDGDESWEIKQNGTDRVGWHSADFSGDDWKNDFEARYPEDNVDTTRLQALAEWLVSTDTEQATGEEITPVTYDDIEYTVDTAEYRLAKFSAELADHFVEEAIIYYYLFTEISLGIDQREKNAFPTYIKSLDRWIVLFYDADSSCGTDNKGNLSFDYYLEDIDYTEGGDPIYNGQNSVLWKNLRATRYAEIMDMYQQMRVDGLISYEIVSGKFETHQGKWPEALFNEDMYRKCIEPLVNDGDGMYLPMLQGKKEQWIKWWLYNRFRYLDTKYITGTSETNKMIIRVKSKANVTLTSYVNMYGHVYYNSEMVEHRMERGKPYEFVWAASGAEDAVIGINDADMLTSLGDLSPHMVEQIDTSLATHLTALKLGDGADDYTNYSLKSFTTGNNKMLRVLDVRNCVNLAQTVDISGCTNIEEAYFEGSSVTGVNLPNGGMLKALHLPNTITNLTICNQPLLTDFVLSDSSNITTLRLENVGSLIDTPSVINNMADGGRIRALDIDWEVNSESDLVVLLNKLIKMRGLDENGNNLDAAVLTGRIRVNEKVSDEIVGEFYNYFADVVIDDGSAEIYIINYKDWDGTILYSMRLAEGEDAINPITEGYISAPARDPDEYYSYEFVGWSIIPTNVSRHYQVIALYTTKVAINFAVDGEIVHSDYAVYGANAEDPVENGKIEIPTKEGTNDLHYLFTGWDGSLSNITMPRTVNAVFSNVYPVRFYATADSPTPHYVQWVIEGNNAYDPSTDEGYTTPPEIMVSADEKLVFSHWGDLPINVTGICEVNANYNTYWAVRFYNESVEVDLQWIKDGSSAVNPITRFEDPIEEPTKVSTAQYDFDFSNWEGNYMDVTDSRKIYAVYSHMIRSYTVYFYNMNQLLYTVENVPYGSDATYVGETPAKLGVDDPTAYDFTGWYPNGKQIQGETKCYALFRYNAYTKDSWTTIAENVANGTALDLYPVGTRKEIPVIFADGSEYTVDVEVIAHNHDDLADNSGKAALTFFCKDLPDFKHKMYEDHNNTGGWPDSDMRAFVNGELFNALPIELQTVIEPVYKISDGGSNSKELKTTVDSCWILSYDEAGFAANRTDNLKGQGTWYSDTFGSGSDGNSTRIKYLSDGYTVGRWWLRTTSYGDTSTLFLRIQNSGGVQTDGLWNEYPVAFGFCIGTGITNAEMEAKHTAVLNAGELGALTLGRSE